jgi:hypothetical protein
MRDRGPGANANTPGVVVPKVRLAASSKADVWHSTSHFWES